MIMRKKKIYLDTSVVSYLRQDDAPDRMADTLELWEILKTGKYDVCVSDITAGELVKCAEPKRTELFALLEEIRYTEIKAGDNEEIAALSIEIQNQGLFAPQKRQ
jgi:predicted nucleic acid-binding protein